MQLLNHVSLARQQTHQSEQQMNFHLGKSMNCPMRLGRKKFPLLAASPAELGDLGD
jgi:hypothetical protein